MYLTPLFAAWLDSLESSYAPSKLRSSKRGNAHVRLNANEEGESKASSEAKCGHQGFASDCVCTLWRPDCPGAERRPIVFNEVPTTHPVLSKPVMIRGEIPADGSPGRSDLSL